MGLALVLVGLTLGLGLWVLVTPASPRRGSTLRQWCDEAGLAEVPLSVIAIVLGTFSVIVGASVSALIPLPAMAPLGALAGLGVPVIVLASVRDLRRRRARALWPDVIDSIRLSLRSGSTVVESVVAASGMIPREWRSAWSEVELDLHRGADMAPTLRKLQRQLADPVADRVVECLILAREFGGTELPSVLADLGRSVRREQSLRNEAQSRQSWVRHAATLGIVAPWVVLAMLASRPENREAYATTAGTILIVVSAGATVVAFLVMKALGTLPEQRRWLIGNTHD